MAVVASVIASTTSFADSATGTCRITVRTHTVDEHTTVKMDEVPANNERDCKSKAKQKEKTTDPKVTKIEVSFHFSEEAD